MRALILILIVLTAAPALAQDCTHPEEIVGRWTMIECEMGVSFQDCLVPGWDLLFSADGRYRWFLDNELRFEGTWCVKPCDFGEFFGCYGQDIIEIRGRDVPQAMAYNVCEQGDGSCGVSVPFERAFVWGLMYDETMEFPPVDPDFVAFEYVGPAVPTASSSWSTLKSMY